MARRNTPTALAIANYAKALIAAGLSVARVEIERGKVNIFTADARSNEKPVDGLDAELEQFEKQFEKKHGDN